MSSVVKISRLYPNPTAGYVTLELSVEATDKTMIRVIKATGQLILERQAQSGECLHELDVSNLPTGLYFLQVFNGDRLIAAEKFVKQ